MAHTPPLEPKEIQALLSDSKLQKSIKFSVRLDAETHTQIEEIAALKNVASAELVRGYIAEGLARDRDRLRWLATQQLVESLRAKGVDPGLLQETLDEVIA